MAKRKIYNGRTASTVILIVALYMCSLCLYVVVGGAHSLHNLLGDTRMSVEIADSSKIEPIPTIESLKEIDGVSEVTFIDSTEALRNFEKFIGVDIKSYMGLGVLPSTMLIEIDPKHSGQREIEAIREQIAKESWVSGVYYESSVVSRTAQNLQIIERFSRLLAMILSGCSLVLIYLGFKMSVGATLNAYARSAHRAVSVQCYRAALVQGVVAAIGAVALLLFSIKYAQISLPALELSLETVPTITAATIILATILSIIFTAIAIAIKSSKK